MATRPRALIGPRIEPRPLRAHSRHIMNTLPIGAQSPARLFIALLLLWLTGAALRFTILAVPPVIPLIHDELRLNATQVGLLSGLPSMLFAIAAVPGSLLIARLGVTSALVIGLAATAIGGAL